jgi:mRNA degradation ribonuclease J1/J2
MEYAYALMKMAGELGMECCVASVQIAKLLEKIPKPPSDYKLMEDYADYLSPVGKVTLDQIGENSLLLVSYREVVHLLKNLSSTHGLAGDPVAIVSEPEPEREEASEYGVITNWLSKLGIQHYRIRVSGHYYPFEIRRIRQVLRPKRIVPIHTEHPELTQLLWKRATQQT